MRIINVPELEVTLSRKDVEELYRFFEGHMLLPKLGTKTEWPVFESLLRIFELLVDKDKKKNDN